MARANKRRSAADQHEKWAPGRTFESNRETRLTADDLSEATGLLSVADEQVRMNLAEELQEIASGSNLTFESRPGFPGSRRVNQRRTRSGLGQASLQQETAKRSLAGLQTKRRRIGVYVRVRAKEVRPQDQLSMRWLPMRVDFVSVRGSQMVDATIVDLGFLRERRAVSDYRSRLLGDHWLA